MLKITYSLFLFSVIISFSAHAQESTPMRVIHGTAISTDSEVLNFYINENDEKFVATTDGIYRVYAIDNATAINRNKASWNLLNIKDGNASLSYTPKLIENILTYDTSQAAAIVQSSFFDAKTNTLWLGTKEAGLFQIQHQATPILIKRYTSSNSKLLSNSINALLVDKYQRVWAGTDKGVFLREKPEGDFKLHEKRERILDLTTLGKDVWILGDGILWMADEKNRWIPGDVDRKLYSGPVKDMKYDSEGRLWVASNIITRYDVVEDKVEVFDQANGFTSNDVRVIQVDQEDALWVGTGDKGLFLIEPEAKMSVSVKILNPVGCEKSPNGVLEAIAIGGTPPYTFSWSNRKTTKRIEGLGMGTYQVSISDANGQSRVAEANFSPPLFDISFDILSPASREDTADGKAQVKVSGGTPPYHIEWDNGEVEWVNSKLSSGKHSLVLTDANNCMGIAQMEMTVQPPLEVAASVEKPEEDTRPDTVTDVATNISDNSNIPPKAKQEIAEKVTPLVVKVSFQENLDCHNSTGAARASVSGGKKPYQYKWSTGATSTSINDLQAGRYYLEVKDADGNVNRQEFSLSAPPAISAKFSNLSPASNERSRDGKAKVNISGGKGSYVVLWDNGETSTLAKKLKYGKHSVSISDANECETIAEVNIQKRIIEALDVSNLRKGQTIQIEQLFFAADSTDVKPSSEPVLNEIYQFLAQNPNISVEIGGHTNDVPSHEYCDALSSARAASVANYLTKKGIPSAQLSYKGYGKRKPLVSNRTAVGRRKNQRVEIKVIDIR